MYFWDESEFQAGTVHDRLWGKKVQASVVDAPASCN